MGMNDSVVDRYEALEYCVSRYGHVVQGEEGSQTAGHSETVSLIKLSCNSRNAWKMMRCWVATMNWNKKDNFV